MNPKKRKLTPKVERKWINSPAHLYMLKLNEEGKAPYEIAHILKAGGYLNKVGREFTVTRVWEFFKMRGVPVINQSIRPQSEKKQYDIQPPDVLPEERPSVLQMALQVLNGHFKREETGYYLWIGKRWVSSNLCDVMKAANRRLHAMNQQQIDINPNWVVK